MNKKTKFMTAILSRDEWEMIKYAMSLLEETATSMVHSFRCKEYQRVYAIVSHFNSVSIANIEDMADKIEKQRKKERRKCQSVQAKKES